MIARWICRHFGHRWAGMPAGEHACRVDWCWRCYGQRPVHLWGPWPHTCDDTEAS